MFDPYIVVIGFCVNLVFVLIWSLFCNTVPNVLSSFAIISLKKREPIVFFLGWSVVCDCGIYCSYSLVLMP